jgi:hypothetical protein
MYRLANSDQNYDHRVAKGLSATMKALRHSVEVKFNGDDAVEVLPFLRSFKEAAAHLNVSEGAATRILPSFLDGMAREGYREHLEDAPDGIQLYPFMVQYLLETYAVDEALTEAYMAVTGARLFEGETEKAFGHRFYKLAIRAGNFIPKDDLRVILSRGYPRLSARGCDYTSPRRPPSKRRCA